MANNVNEFVCPACGSSLKFDAASQVIKCPYCDSEFDINDLNNFAAEDKEFKDEATWNVENAMNEFASDEQEQMSSYLCDACGGEVICGPNTSSTSCPYCGNNVLIKSRLTGALKPKYIIPFKKTSDDAKDALKAYYKGKILLPKVFKDQNKINEIKPLYVPYWLYDADVDARIQYEGEIRDTWEDREYKYEETKYYRIVREGNIAYEHLPVDASKSIDNTLTEAIEPFNFNEAQEFVPAYLAGYMSDKYDVTAEEASGRATERIKQGTEIAFRQTISNKYDTVRTKSSNIKLYNTNADYAFYPLYILSTKWNDTVYTFAMNGETGKIKGNLPMSKGKFFGLMFGILGGFGLLGLIFSLILFATESKSPFIPLFIFLILGLIVSMVVTFSAKAKLKGIKPQIGSASYYKDDSLDIQVSKDYYLYKKVIKHRKPQENNSRN